MNTTLWIVQAMVAALFLMVGTMKLTASKEKLDKMGMTKSFSIGTIRFIGLVDALGAVGLIVPLLTGIAPILTPIAAVSLCVVMVFAAIHHFRKQENKPVMFNLLLLALSAFVAVGRF